MNRFQRFFEYGKLRLLRLVNPGKNPRTVTPGGRFAGFPPWHPRRTVPAAAAAVVLGVLLLIPHPVKAQSAGPDTAAFTAQGCTIWTVPADVSMVQIQAIGAAGAPGYTSPGGLGDGVEGVLSGLTGGDSLYVCVNVGGGVPGFSGGGGASGVALGADFSVPACRSQRPAAAPVPALTVPAVAAAGTTPSVRAAVAAAVVAGRLRARLGQLRPRPVRV